MPYWDLDWRLPTAPSWALRGRDFIQSCLPRCTHAVTLPHSPRVESLNVAAAAVPLLLERRRATMTLLRSSTGDDASFDYDVIVIGAGYGGFDAAKHAADTASKPPSLNRGTWGTCVNRGCVPSKRFSASGKVRELADDQHLASFGIHAAPVRFERQKIADHANNLVQTIRTNLTKTLERAGVTILRGHGRLEGSQRVGLREPSGVDR